MVLKTWEIFFKYHHLGGLLLVALVAAALYVKHDISYWNVVKKRVTSKEEQLATKHDSTTNYDFFSGRWVYDDVSYPLYKEEQCSFVEDSFACEKYGRKDLKYQQWRWQPHHCDIPRFDGKAFLEKIRGKKVLFVGDSLNRNQWVSLLCLIESSISPSSNKSVTLAGNLLYFHDIIRNSCNFFFLLNLKEYNATIGFYWSPLLVESNCDDPDKHSVKDRIIRITSIEKHARHWTDADILVFDSFMWWLEPTMTLLWGSFGSSDAIYKRVEMRLRRYEMALNTWSDWLEININRTKTKLFFMSLSPYHLVYVKGERWDVQQNCYNETEPIFKEEYWGISTDPNMMHIAESTIQKLEKRGLKIEYLNITHLSDYRKDAHPSIYRKFFHPISEEQLASPKSYSDCVHWCLPGVPDIWNQILYSYIINSS
ncbi:hypothetical protein DH2020_048035 [Rehmannia glutinosa]|uniref:Trichome birefringence-like N-terminal domain-containing protein n=1 Tax=Rehmannia glutinosa TaxID=99300 RepID=A0ABR0U6Z4_REHGL